MLSPNLKYDSEKPLYEQLYNYIKKEIKKFHLKRGEKLPSKRNLAENVGISINTVTRAYEILIDEGYIFSEERKGYFVSSIENLAKLKIIVDEKKEIKTEERKKYKYNFRINTTDTKNFPIYTFKKVINNILNEESDKWLKAKDSQGLYDLRYDISNYLRQSRDVKTNPENIIIGSGTEYLLQILMYILPKETVFAIENPGYKLLIEQLKTNDEKFLSINIDDNGLNYDELTKSSANALFITPSHQFPTGIIMPINRRLNILNWADINSRNYIIEDDYDSEFKYYGRPIPALKSLDKRDNVIYMGNFSKSLSPSFRISYMVLPNSLLEKYFKVMPFMTCPVSNFSQLILSRFMREGYFERHLNRMRNIYKKKREALIDYIKKNVDENKYEIIDSQAGLHFMLRVKNGLSEKELIEIGRRKDVFIQGISEYLTKEHKRIKYPKIIIGYGAMDINNLKAGIKILIDAWEEN